MSFLNTFTQIIQVISALVVIGLVLMQHGKGADMGAAFGSGASGSVFGATGSSNFLSKATAWAAATFFATTLAMAFFLNKSPTGNSVMNNAPAVPAIAAPAKPAVPADAVPTSLPAAPSNATTTTTTATITTPTTTVAPAATPAKPAEVPKK